MNPETLSARILEAIYFPQNNILQAELGSRTSAIWRSLHEGCEALKLGLIRRIGDGKDMSFMEDNWIPRDFKLPPICPKK